MSSIQDIVMSASLNISSVFTFFMVFAVLRLQPFNDRVYFPKWYLRGIRTSPTHAQNYIKKFVNLDCRTYLRFLNWMPAAIRMPESELIDHAGLDSAVYVRIYLLGLKIFAPISILALGVLIPINVTGSKLVKSRDLEFSEIDKLSISNIDYGSHRFWAHVIVAYISTFWSFYVLFTEYEKVESLRLHFLATAERRPDQFTVFVRNIPPDPDESVSEQVEHFFSVNHHDHYLSHQVVYNANYLSALVEQRKAFQNWFIYYENKYNRNPSRRPTTKTGFFGLWGQTVDGIEYYKSEIERLLKEEAVERQRMFTDPKSIMPVAFVSFKTRWGAAVCSQTVQTCNPTLWLTDWAPEPRDVYWPNLTIPFVELTIRKLIMHVALFFIIFFFMIPIAFVQSLANVNEIENAMPFMKPLVETDFVKSFIQGVLPGITLKVFLILCPTVLMIITRVEGHTSLSKLDRHSASKYYFFLLVNVFLGSVATGTAFEQLHSFVHEPARKIPVTIGMSIPMKATFFITYIMIDGWSSVAAEILRMKQLIIFHLKVAFFVKTEKDREQAMNPGCLDFSYNEPRIQLYFVLGFVYHIVTPVFLPFLLIFFILSYVVFRHQIINVYHQQYESGAAYWPDVAKRLITALLISQVLFMGLLSTKHDSVTIPILLLPGLTLWFYKYCKTRFEPAFVNFPVQDAVVRDTLEQATEPDLNLRGYLQDAYIHPVFRREEIQHPLPPTEITRVPSIRTTPAPAPAPAPPAESKQETEQQPEDAQDSDATHIHVV